MAIKLPSQMIEEFIRKTPEVLTSGNIAEGQFRKSVESKIVELVPNSQNAILTSSNGTGLFACLQYYKTLGVNTVFIQSNTMYGIKTIVNLAGMNPVVLPAPNLVMDTEALTEALEYANPHASVVLYSHIGGSTGFNIKEIKELCDTYGVPLLEDCAHTLGAQTSLYGDAGVFSFYATKALPAGEGGVIFTDNEDLNVFVTRFMMYDRIHMEYDVGMNIRVSEIQALLADTALNFMDEIVDNRRKSMIEYESACKEFGIFTYYQDQDIRTMQHNAYKFIITDPRVIKFFVDRIVAKGEYTGNDVLTGTVFGYSLDPKICEPVPHICLNTNYDVSQDLISATIDLLKQSVA